VNKAEIVTGLHDLAKNKGWKNLYCQTPALIETYELDRAAFFTDQNPGGNYPAITDCEILIARTGTMVLSSAQSSGRALPVHTPVHIVIASVSQLVFDIKDGIEQITSKPGGQLPSAVFFTTGPSRTGDIEKTLVMGVHGPIEVYIFLRTDQ
jgi:L-lactate dehydrogenase complex protein LldG